MGNLRKLEVRLGQNVEDRLLQRLGYREYLVTAPSGDEISPRPRVEQIDINRISETLAAELLRMSPDARMPNALYKVYLSRNFDYAEFTEGGTWLLQRDDWDEATSCAIFHHQEKDARIELTLGVLKF